MPLADVLKRLDELSDWKFEATMAATARVSIDRLEGVTIQQALEVLLPAAGCAARLDGRKRQRDVDGRSSSAAAAGSRRFRHRSANRPVTPLAR
ncbi:MAG: hypothetical protein CM1200mP2_42990 [Planctomycetaceae bacterium]|nr:MAG: hypothetical protein CM1200mP2_42990 [Planctomycetaceae bacterium]